VEIFAEWKKISVGRDGVVSLTAPHVGMVGREELEG